MDKVDIEFIWTVILEHLEGETILLEPIANNRVFDMQEFLYLANTITHDCNWHDVTF